jgi:hypothetical protein
MSAVHTTGETPGAGTYYCLVCAWRITLEADQVMPVCGGVRAASDLPLLPLPVDRTSRDRPPYRGGRMRPAMTTSASSATTPIAYAPPRPVDRPIP